mgnify:CR=1 FL=1
MRSGILFNSGSANSNKVLRYALKKGQAESFASEAELLFRVLGIPPHVKELRFHDMRKWRFDYAWPDYKVAVELEGGIWSGGRHVRGSGFQNDCEKYNHAVMLGWKIYRFSAKFLKDGHAEKCLLTAFKKL